MKILSYQGVPSFCNKKENLQKINTICKSASEINVDVVVFPELFTTGYNLGDKVRDVSETVNGYTISELKKIAKSKRVNIITGFAEYADGVNYNSAVVISSNGDLLFKHRKVFLFGDVEKNIFSPGSGFKYFDLMGRKCGLSICYDIEFPEAIRVLAKNKVEVLFNPTANMIPYYEVPTTLVRARSLENGLVTVYANMCGNEGEMSYTGQSAIVSPEGIDLARAGEEETLLVVDVKNILEKHKDFPLSTQLTDLINMEDKLQINIE